MAEPWPSSPHLPEAKKPAGWITELGIDPPAYKKKYTDRDACQGMVFGCFFDNETLAREQQGAGHYEPGATPFETFGGNVRDQLARVWGSSGSSPARDIEAIRVNRWPQGYAYE